jgi:hypothetical protein
LSNSSLSLLLIISRQRQNGLHIQLLSFTYTRATQNIHTFPEAIESPAMVYMPHIGHYIIFGSHLTGWDANDNVYSFAPSLSGPWSEWKVFAEEGSNTYNSQTDFLLPIGLTRSSDKGTVVWMGDRWDPQSLERSTYVWQPLEIEFADNSPRSLQVHMDNLRSWSLNLKTGIWEDDGMKGAVTQAETAKLLKGAKIVDCDRCDTGKAVGKIDAGGIRFENIASIKAVRAAVLVHYLHDGKNEQFGDMIINDGPSQHMAFLPSRNITSDGVTKAPFVSSLMGNLKEGQNTIEIRGVNGCSIMIDRIEVAIP